MNKQSEKKIEWCDFTFNPVTGCNNNCEYCYACKISMRFKGHFFPEFHPGRLKQPYSIKKPSRIFVVSMGDLWGPWVPVEWQDKVLQVVKDNPQHTFMFLTKFPKGYEREDFPANSWLGMTLTEKTALKDIAVFNVCNNDRVKFVSIEPLMSPDTRELLQFVTPLNWAICGGRTPIPCHETQWVEQIIHDCRDRNIPIFIKSNLKYYNEYHEFPESR